MRIDNLIGLILLRIDTHLGVAILTFIRKFENEIQLISTIEKDRFRFCVYCSVRIKRLFIYSR